MNGGDVASDDQSLVRMLIAREGETFAEEVGLHLNDEPDALWQLFVLAQLLSARIGSEAAVASARELFAIGCTSAAGTRATTWQQRVDALGRGGYRRYDFSTSTRLGKNATMVRERWSDDLRSLRDEADAEPARIVTLLQEFDGIGPAGAGIFVREVQGVWTLRSPFVDQLTRKGAALLDLPTEAGTLAGLVEPSRLPNLCAALVRVARGPAAIREGLNAADGR